MRTVDGIPLMPSQNAIAKQNKVAVHIRKAYYVYSMAAELCRTLRRKGVTIRNAVDCMIAAVAIEHDIPLLQNDRDFIPIVQNCGLKNFDIHPYTSNHKQSP
ncbi:MAG: PIN domain-containing protein [Kiritimatiellia bacterium]